MIVNLSYLSVHIICPPSFKTKQGESIHRRLQWGISEMVVL